MPYIKTNLIARPGYRNLGLAEELGSFADTLKSGASSALDFFGSGIKAQGAQEALAAQLTAQNALLAQQKAGGGGGGIPTTALVIGGLALVGVLVFAMRKPKTAG